MTVNNELFTKECNYHDVANVGTLEIAQKGFMVGTAAQITVELIRHFATKIEHLENQIKTLTPNNQEKEQIRFKVGWVYKNGHGSDILILNSASSDDPYPLKGIRLNDFLHNRESQTYSLDGYYNMNDKNLALNLIHSTGRKWEPQE